MYVIDQCDFGRLSVSLILKMPGRYEIVDEPVESLEVIDDEVYHPDLTIRDTPSSFRSLEPIIAGPITLKTIFYDPRWSRNKRRCCIGFALLASLICFSLMISLFVGLGQVLSYISESERLRQTGLYMVPDLEQSDLGVFFYNLDTKFSTVNNKSIAEIQNYLDEYTKQAKDYDVCSSGERSGNGNGCRFDLDWLGTSCTASNRYGYDDGKPCILFALRNVKISTSNLSKAFFDETPELRERIRLGQKLDQYHLPLTCNMSHVNSPVPIEEDVFRYYPEAGFHLKFLANNGDDTKHQLAPLVFVQFLKHPTNMDPQFNVKCQVWVPSGHEFRGVRTIDFEYDGTLDVQGNALEKP